MTDRSDDLVNIVAEALRDADRRFHRIDPRYFPRMAQAAIDAMELTRQTRDMWPPEESGVPGPLHEICWQTPWVVGDD